QQGLLNETRNNYKRMNVRAKLDTDINEWLSVGGNFNLSVARQYVGEDAAWFSSYFAVPIIPVYDSLNTGASPHQLSNAQQIGYRSRQNPFYPLLYNDNRKNIAKMLGNISADMEIIPNRLTFRTAYNYKLEGINERNVDFAYNDGVTEVQSAIRRENLSRFDQIWDNYLTYTDFFGNHNLTVVIGQSYRSEYSELLFARGEGISPIPDRDAEHLWYLSNATNFDLNSIGDANDDVINFRLLFQSYFARLAYNYDDRYLVYGTFRRDGNNKFQKTWG